jgi:hypothetical protein
MELDTDADSMERLASDIDNCICIERPPQGILFVWRWGERERVRLG